MILSVSQLMIGSGAAIPSKVVNLSMCVPFFAARAAATPTLLARLGERYRCRARIKLLLQLPHIGEVAGDRCRRGHRRADEMRAPAPALAPLEIAVRGRSAALARQQLVGIHGKAHGASGLPP